MAIDFANVPKMRFVGFLHKMSNMRDLNMNMI